MRIHPITGMPLEDGHGALSDDEQALKLHLPYIEQTQGEDIADAMRAKILAHEKLEEAQAEVEEAEHPHGE